MKEPITLSSQQLNETRVEAIVALATFTNDNQITLSPEEKSQLLTYAQNMIAQNKMEINQKLQTMFKAEMSLV